MNVLILYSFLLGPPDYWTMTIHSVYFTCTSDCLLPRQLLLLIAQCDVMIPTPGGGGRLPCMMLTVPEIM